MEKNDYSSIPSSKIDYDELFEHIGGFGKYQILILIPLALTHFVHGLYVEGAVFLQAIPKHRCAIQTWSEDTYLVQSSAHDKVISYMIPFTKRDGQREYDTCHICNGSINMYGNDTYKCNGTEQSCNAWVYDKSIFTSTVTSDMNFVCSDGLKPAHAQTAMMGGELLGVMVFGSLSDKFGRKLVICLSVTGLIISGIPLTWTHNFTIYSILRLFSGFFNAGSFVTGLVLGIELVGPSKRVVTASVTFFAFLGGIFYLCIAAYFVRDWRILNLIITCPFILQLTYWCILSESPRWSSQNGKMKEATAVLKMIARVNGKENVHIPQIAEQKSSVSNGRLIDIFSSRTLLIWTLVIVYNWTVVTLAYFGFALNSGNLSGDIYVDFALGSLVEIPAYTLFMVLSNRIGRKPLFVSGLVIGGIACLITAVLIVYASQSYQYLIVAISLIGKMGIAMSFCAIYLYTAELFPTVIRGSIFGLCEVFARGGGMVAPYVVNVGILIGGKFGTAFPMLAFGVLAVIGGLLAFVLPETLHETLPETMEDGIELGRKMKRNIDHTEHRSSKEERIKLLS